MEQKNNKKGYAFTRLLAFLTIGILSIISAACDMGETKTNEQYEYLTIIGDSKDSKLMGITTEGYKIFLAKDSNNPDRLVYAAFKFSSEIEVPFKDKDSIKVTFSTSPLSGNQPAVINDETTKVYLDSVPVKIVKSAKIYTVEKPDEQKPAAPNPQEALAKPEKANNPGGK